jgi:hypothetical protein
MIQYSILNSNQFMAVGPQWADTGSMTRGILLLTGARRRSQNIWQVGVNLPG